ncbi:MAG: hypothetical protein IJT75_02270 [Bacteroidaceae bacterium]|nr:hypothetical protein [Bacteroidaceae bacterium]
MEDNRSQQTKVTTPLSIRRGVGGEAVSLLQRGVGRASVGVTCLFLLFFFPTLLFSQINTDRVMLMGRNALYYEDYVLSIQRFNMVINAKPYLSEPFFFLLLDNLYL